MRTYDATRLILLATITIILVSRYIPTGRTSENTPANTSLRLTPVSHDPFQSTTPAPDPAHHNPTLQLSGLPRNHSTNPTSDTAANQLHDLLRDDNGQGWTIAGLDIIKSVHYDKSFRQRITMESGQQWAPFSFIPDEAAPSAAGAKIVILTNERQEFFLMLGNSTSQAAFAHPETSAVCP